MLKRVVLGSLVGAATGGVISFVLAGAAMKKTAAVAAAAEEKQEPAPPAQQQQLSSEAKEILELFDPFQKWPEYETLKSVIGELESLMQTPKLTREQRFVVSKLASRAHRCFDTFELKNKTVLPLDFAEDLKRARKFIDDYKFNLFQASS